MACQGINKQPAPPTRPSQGSWNFLIILRKFRHNFVTTVYLYTACLNVALLQKHKQPTNKFDKSKVASASVITQVPANISDNININN